eukprot:752534-Prymnesium_polylepis.2
MRRSCAHVARAFSSIISMSHTRIGKAAPKLCAIARHGRRDQKRDEAEREMQGGRIATVSMAAP